MAAYNEDARNSSNFEHQMGVANAPRSLRSDYLEIEKGVLKGVLDENGNPVDLVAYLTSDCSMPYRRNLVERALNTGEVYEENADGTGNYKFSTERVSAVLPNHGARIIPQPRSKIDNTWLEGKMNENAESFVTYRELRAHWRNILYRVAELRDEEPEYREPLRMREKKKVLAPPKNGLQGRTTDDIQDYMSRVFPRLWK